MSNGQEKNRIDTRYLIFWLLPVSASFIVMLGAFLLYTAACAVHYYYNITHP